MCRKHVKYDEMIKGVVRCFTSGLEGVEIVYLSRSLHSDTLAQAKCSYVFIKRKEVSCLFSVQCRKAGCN